MSTISSNADQLAWNFYHNPRQPYDDFVAHYILIPMKLSFVQRHYERSLAEFIDEAPDVAHHFTTVHGAGGEAWLAEIIGQIELAGIRTLFAFLDRVTTREQAEEFLGITGIAQPSLMDWMDYLKQWWFPYPATLRQLVENDGDPLMLDVLGKLKAARIANSFTMLEAGVEPAGREKLIGQMGIDGAYLLDLVHRADVSRLPYTSGGAVKRLWVMGYRSLAALRTADPDEYAVRIEAYFAAGGKGSSFDAKMATIKGFLQDARLAPEVVKVTG
jgi:hypothetical protein